MGRWDGVSADRAYHRLRELPVRLADTPTDRDGAWDLSRRHDEHPIDDMLYVALASGWKTRCTPLISALPGAW